MAISLRWSVLPLVLALLQCASADLLAIWNKELPSTKMPDALVALTSPLSPSLSNAFLGKLESGGDTTEIAYCAAAKFANCFQDSAVVFPVAGVQPRVCIPPYFIYEYGVLPCRHPGPEAVAQLKQSAMFFKPEAMQEGKMVTVPKTENKLKESGMFFLPASIAEALHVPLNEAHLEELKSFYGVQTGSEMEQHMQNTLAQCAHVSRHELRSCHLSAESIVGFVSSSMGRHATVQTPQAFSRKQQAEVVSVHELAHIGDSVISCHDLKFPSLLYSCHVSRMTRLLDVDLRLQPEDELASGMVACHEDTSFWNPSHIAFQALHMRVGQGPICHWLPENSFVFV